MSLSNDIKDKKGVDAVHLNLLEIPLRKKERKRTRERLAVVEDVGET